MLFTLFRTLGFVLYLFMFMISNVCMYIPVFFFVLSAAWVYSRRVYSVISEGS